jgi:hypothetical protein
VHGFTVAQLAGRDGGVGVPAVRYRFRQALQRFVARPHPVPLPAGPLVLVLDGLWFQFAGRPWVLYLIAVKPCGANYAVFLAPQLLPGPEHVSRWERVLAGVPPAITSRVQAMVTDNLRGMRQLARARGWVLQLCHFHLLLKLEAHRRGRRRRTLRGGAIREHLIALVRSLLTLPDGAPWDAAHARLRRRARTDCGTHRIQMMVREFLRDLPHYRAYRRFPSLGLPHTTNTLECMGRLLRDLFRHSRAGSHPTSVLLWATAFIRFHPTITCNGYTINRIP